MRKGIKKVVNEILIQDEYSRTDDNYLMMRVVQELEPELAGTSFVNVMQGLKFKGISLESVSRARRRFQEENPSFKDKQTADARAVEEENYFIEYSR